MSKKKEQNTYKQNAEQGGVGSSIPCVNAIALHVSVLS
jgi:hypothetical protein